MSQRAVAFALAALLASAGNTDAAGRAQVRSRQTIRVIDQTTILGESDPLLWKSILELLPERPARIEVLDLASVSEAARRRLRGLDAFVLAGHRSIVVIRQGRTLRNAETGDAADRLALASLVWHEMAHLNGLDERAALDREQALWRRFIGAGRIDSGIGMAYIARLREIRARAATGSPPSIQLQ